MNYVSYSPAARVSFGGYFPDFVTLGLGVGEGEEKADKEEEEEEEEVDLSFWCRGWWGSAIGGGYGKYCRCSL